MPSDCPPAQVWGTWSMGPSPGVDWVLLSGAELVEAELDAGAAGAGPVGAAGGGAFDEPPQDAVPQQRTPTMPISAAGHLVETAGRGGVLSASGGKIRFESLMRGREPQVLAARKLPRSFYARPVLMVARECIGKILVHRTDEGTVGGRIVECEAYRGPLDRAAHSSRGLTPRTRAMFGPPGYAYVYLLYGTSWAFNIVVASEGEPHAVLVRALEPTENVELMVQRRGRPAASRELTNGPGKLCHALAITGGDYGRDLCGPDLFLLEGARGPVGRSARINVDYAGAWAEKRWRFFEKGNRYVSVRPRV